MGYSLTIGEAVLGKIGDDEWGAGYVYVTAEEVHHDDAPAFGEPTDYKNERWPSYSSWADFADFAGLTDILFDPTSPGNIRGGHPGHFLITEKFKADVDAAMERYMKKYPDAVPTYKDFENRRHDGELCRFVWLQYWTDWALENCKNPIFLNT